MTEIPSGSDPAGDEFGRHFESESRVIERSRKLLRVYLALLLIPIAAASFVFFFSTDEANRKILAEIATPEKQQALEDLADPETQRAIGAVVEHADALDRLVEWTESEEPLPAIDDLAALAPLADRAGQLNALSGIPRRTAELMAEPGFHEFAMSAPQVLAASRVLASVEPGDLEGIAEVRDRLEAVEARLDAIEPAPSGLPDLDRVLIPDLLERIAELERRIQELEVERATPVL